jgi:hypothetical protein
MVDVWNIFTLRQKSYNWISHYSAHLLATPTWDTLQPSVYWFKEPVPCVKTPEVRCSVKFLAESKDTKCVAALYSPPGATLATPFYFIPSLDRDFSCRDQWLPSRTDLITMQEGQWQIFVAHLFRSALSWLLYDVSYLQTVVNCKLGSSK